MMLRGRCRRFWWSWGMSEWIRSTVGDVTTYQRAGGTPTATRDSFYGGDIPFVTIEDITNGNRFLDRTEKKLSESGLASSAAWLIREPHILYSMYATVGKPIINRIACATNQAIIALKESAEIDQSFLFYQLLFIRPDVYKYTAQTTQSNLNAGSVKRLPIKYPKDKREQRKIATILTAADTAIEKTDALIEKYQQIKAGLMHDLFTRGVLPNGQLRPPRNEAPELYQETAIGWIPLEWSAKTLRTACDWYSGGTPSKQNEAWWEGSMPWLSPKDMKRFELEDTEDHITREAAIFGSRIAPASSVFIVVRGMILAHSFPVVMNRKEFSFNQDVKAVISRPPLRSRYLGYWFVANTDLFLKKTTESTHGTKRFDLNDLYQISIGVPCESEQQRMISRLDMIEQRIQTEIAQREKLKIRKLGLMQDLLTGKVLVKVDEMGNNDA